MAEVQSGVAETIKILITDRIAREGIELLRTQLPQAQIDEQPGIKQEQLKAIIGEYHALIVRSETQVTGDILTAATRLKPKSARSSLQTILLRQNSTRFTPGRRRSVIPTTTPKRHKKNRRRRT